MLDDNKTSNVYNIMIHSVCDHSPKINYILKSWRVVKNSKKIKEAKRKKSNYYTKLLIIMPRVQILYGDHYHHQRRKLQSAHLPAIGNFKTGLANFSSYMYCNVQ